MSLHPLKYPCYCIHSNVGIQAEPGPTRDFSLVWVFVLCPTKVRIWVELPYQPEWTQTRSQSSAGRFFVRADKFVFGLDYRIAILDLDAKRYARHWCVRPQFVSESYCGHFKRKYDILRCVFMQPYLPGQELFDYTGE